ncbi:MAG: TonB-dependent receptor, partial [Bacteroidota bacterium]
AISNMDYSLPKSTIFLFSLLLSVLSSGLAAQVSGSLTGRVLDKTGSPLIGAYLELTDTDFRAATDVDGNYQIKDVPYGNYTLKISYIGSADKSLAVTINGSELTLEIRLEEEANLLAETIVVGKSGAREQQEQAIQIESVQIQAVISRVKDVGEVLERLPGVNVRGTGSFGDRVDISLNGLNGTAVRTYLDGLPLEFIMPQFTINNIPVNSIARVDVYKGVVPIDVGSDALGGGVNVVTAQRSVNEIQASYGYGSFNTHQAALSGNFAISEGISIGTNLNYNYSDNDFTMDAFVWEDQERREITRFNDAYRLFDATTYVDVRDQSWADRFRFTVNANQFYKELQNGGTIGNFSFGEAFTEGQGVSATLRYDKKIGEKLELSTTNALSRVDVLYEDTTANLYSWSGEVIAVQPRERGELSHSRSDRDFTNLASRINLRWAITPRDEVLLTNLLARQSTIGRDEVLDLERDPLTKTQVLLKDVVGLQYRRSLFKDKLELSAAGKYYYYDLQGINPRNLEPQLASGDRVGYYVTAKYDFTDNFFARASYENALRVPTAPQFFGNGGNIRANVELQPEISDNYNLGFSYTSPRRDFRWAFTANGFLRFQDELIFLQGTEFQRFINADAVETSGVEGSVTLRYRDKVRLDINATRLRQVYGRIDGTVQAQVFEGTDFPNVPKWFYNARLTFNQDLDNENSFSAYAQYKYVDQFNFLNVSATFDPAVFIPVQQRVDLGVQLSLKDGKYNLALNANNIFDADIFDNFSVPRPGRAFNFRLGYRLANFGQNN